MRKLTAQLARIVLVSVAVFLTYATVLSTPALLFPFSVRADNLVLHSDRQFSQEAGKHVLELAARKLTRSPLYSGQQEYQVFVCNSSWRQMLFFNKDYGAGGVAQYPITPKVFLREARIEENHLMSRAGIPVTGDRSLDYFVAHEITHQLTGSAIGFIRFYRLPQWVREGYADYIGKGESFDYNQARRAFLSGAPEMEWHRSGLYSRFHLLVAYLLDKRHLELGHLLRNPPPQAEVEAAIRGEE